MPKTPTDPLRSQLFELVEDSEKRLTQLRDFASIPGNAWLAKSELQSLGSLLGDLESLLEEIKQSDSEAGY